jgi:hypothetical protein
MPMKSESREEARARMREQTAAERRGMESVQEGQLVAFPRTEEIVAREDAINEYGEALFAAQTALDDQPLEYAPETDEALNASANRPTRNRRSAKKSSRNGRRGKQAGGENQPEA